MINVPKPMNVQILLFALLAETASRREVQLVLPAGSTVRDAVDQLMQAYPRLQNAPMQHVFFAVNHEYAPEETVLNDGDELALIPPVSGGSGEDDVAGAADAAGGSDAAKVAASSDDGRFVITTDPLQPDVASELVGGQQMGALCTFVGTVRGVTGDVHTTHLFYEAYPDMAVAEMERIAAEIKQRWPDVHVAMQHRIGKVDIGEAAVVIAVAAPHRDNAFPACRFGIDEVKRRCPIWKKEYYTDGVTEWVAPDEQTAKAAESQ